MRHLLTSAVLVMTASIPLAAQQQRDRVPTGTEITIRTNEAIDAKYPSDSRIYTGSVDRDVMGRNGTVLIPKGSAAELIMRDVSDNKNIVLDLESITVNGQRYIVDSQETTVTGENDRRQGVGANQRTGKYVGGGAAIGAIIGAIAGGGKGAAIGAATGAGAGAVGQTVTRGGSVRLPSESLITFRLDRGLRLGTDHNSFDRDGRHYHRYDRDTSSRTPLR